jgi:hypothetical protein
LEEQDDEIEIERAVGRENPCFMPVHLLLYARTNCYATSCSVPRPSRLRPSSIPSKPLYPTSTAPWLTLKVNCKSWMLRNPHSSSLSNELRAT